MYCLWFLTFVGHTQLELIERVYQVLGLGWLFWAVPGCLRDVKLFQAFSLRRISKTIARWMLLCSDSLRLLRWVWQKYNLTKFGACQSCVLLKRLGPVLLVTHTVGVIREVLVCLEHMGLRSSVAEQVIWFLQLLMRLDVLHRVIEKQVTVILVFVNEDGLSSLISKSGLLHIRKLVTRLVDRSLWLWFSQVSLWRALLWIPCVKRTYSYLFLYVVSCLIDDRELQFLFHGQNVFLRKRLAFDGCLQVKNRNVVLRNCHAIPHDVFLSLNFLIAILALRSIMIIQLQAGQSV